MILVSGFNVYPNEIEDLISTLPGVLECAAFGVPDAKAGEAVKLVVVKKDPGLSEADIRHFCEANLTGYKRPQMHRVPRRPAQEPHRQDPAPRAARSQGLNRRARGLGAHCRQ